MKLISCEFCGVVLDLDKITVKDEQGTYGEYHRVIECPCCKNTIFLYK